MRGPSPLLCLLLLPVVLTTGCAAASAVGAAIGAAFSGLAYFADGTGERTFVVPLPEVWRASLEVLRLMDLTITEGSRDEHEGELTGTAPELTVTLTMTTVTARATRVMIDAGNGGLGRDRATASEVLNQLALLLSPTPAAGQPVAHPLLPPPRDRQAPPGARPGDLEQRPGGAELVGEDGGEVGGPAGEPGGGDRSFSSADEGGSGAGEGCRSARSPQEDLGEAEAQGGPPAVPAEKPPAEG